MRFISDVVSALLPRTLKSKVDILVAMTDLIERCFGVVFPRIQLSKPHLGIVYKVFAWVGAPLA